MAKIENLSIWNHTLERIAHGFDKHSTRQTCLICRKKAANDLKEANGFSRALSWKPTKRSQLWNSSINQCALDLAYPVLTIRSRGLLYIHSTTLDSCQVSAGWRWTVRMMIGSCCWGHRHGHNSQHNLSLCSPDLPGTSCLEMLLFARVRLCTAHLRKQRPPSNQTGTACLTPAHYKAQMKWIHRRNHLVPLCTNSFLQWRHSVWMLCANRVDWNVAQTLVKRCSRGV